MSEITSSPRRCDSISFLNIKLAISLIGEYPREKDSWQKLTEELKTLTGRKGKDLFMPLRSFLTGKKDGPDMKKLFPLMQKIQKPGSS